MADVSVDPGPATQDGAGPKGTRATSRIAALRVTASSADGNVRVELLGNGSIGALDIAEGAADYGMRTVSRAVVETLGRAQTELLRRTHDVIAEEFGAAAARAVLPQRDPPAELLLADDDEHASVLR